MGLNDFISVIGLTCAFIFASGVFYAKTSLKLDQLSGQIKDSDSVIKLYIEDKLTEITVTTEKRINELADEMKALKTKMEMLMSLRREK
jgi:uncharacterized membrane protein YciS (DUF1049 family)